MKFSYLSKKKKIFQNYPRSVPTLIGSSVLGLSNEVNANGSKEVHGISATSETIYILNYAEDVLL
jgi:hypothetical protein